MSRKEARITPLRGSSTAADSIVGARIGRIVAMDDRGLHVEFGQAQRLAKLAISLDADALRVAIDTSQPAVLVFENGDESLPIVIGLIEPVRVATESQLETKADAPVVEADVDGRRVRVTAKDEIVLECGPASITLRRNGRVLIRGTHVESYSDGANRIKGGQVRIN